MCLLRVSAIHFDIYLYPHHCFTKMRSKKQRSIYIFGIKRFSYQNFSKIHIQFLVRCTKLVRIISWTWFFVFWELLKFFRFEISTFLQNLHVISRTTLRICLLFILLIIIFRVLQFFHQLNMYLFDFLENFYDFKIF